MRYLAYPFLLFANLLAATFAIRQQLPLDSILNLQIMASLAYLALLEFLFPFKEEWVPAFKDWLRDLFYFSVNGFWNYLGKVLVATVVIKLVPAQHSLPLVIAAPLALVIAELGGYLWHRLGHVDGFFWKVHGIHHVPEKVNVINNNTAHFLNITIGSFVKILPLVLLGFGQEAIFFAVLFTTVQSFAVHVNADVPTGILGHVFMTPEHHRLHHSTVVAEAGNFGSALTLWDQVFGTLVTGHVPEKVGVAHPEQFPAPNHIIANAMLPFLPKHKEPGLPQEDPNYVKSPKPISGEHHHAF